LHEINDSMAYLASYWYENVPHLKEVCELLQMSKDEYVKWWTEKYFKIITSGVTNNE